MSLAMHTPVSEYGYADFAAGDVARYRCHTLAVVTRASG
jgi:hypothetical protein